MKPSSGPLNESHLQEALGRVHVSSGDDGRRLPDLEVGLWILQWFVNLAARDEEWEGCGWLGLVRLGGWNGRSRAG